jgi:cobalt-zinc-cadmium efflux system outer membrane protein
MNAIPINHTSSVISCAYQKRILQKVVGALLLLINLSVGFAQPLPPIQVALKLTLPKAEKMFLDSNLLLLASKYNVDAQKALIIQARLYPNPNINYSRGPLSPIHDPTSSVPNSNFTTNSEVAAGISQMILLAGKRNKQIKIAEANVTLAECQFFDLMRTLKYTLRSDFYNIYYLQQSAQVFDSEIKALQQIADAYDQEKGKYISEKEVVRIKAQLYSFQTEYNDLNNQINDIQGELKLILRVKPKYSIVSEPDTASIAKLTPTKYSVTTLLDSAYKNRTDLLLAKANTEINKLTYRYQKALAVPDLTISVAYDHQGSYASDYTSAGIAIDLPFFNRNQGNIKMSKIMIDNAMALQQSAEETVEENVVRALQKAYSRETLNQKIDPKFASDFERLAKEVVDSYTKRNISILEFLDFYDSYKQNVLQVNAMRYGKIQALEDINFYTATNFFN